MPTANVRRLLPLTVRYLAAAARKRKLVSYTDAAESIGTHCRSVRHPLWEVHRRCMSNGWPPLTAIVVGKRTRRPEAAFPAELLPSSRECSQLKWRKLLADVYDFDWDSVLPILLGT